MNFEVYHIQIVFNREHIIVRTDEIRLW